MKHKTKSKVASIDNHETNDNIDINDYRLIKLNAYQGQNSWDFCGRDGEHGPYPFPYRAVKMLNRKS